MHRSNETFSSPFLLCLDVVEQFHFRFPPQYSCYVQLARLEATLIQEREYHEILTGRKCEDSAPKQLSEGSLDPREAHGHVADANDLAVKIKSIAIAINEHEQEFSKERQNARALDTEMSAVANQLQETAYEVNTLKTIGDQ